MPNSITASGVTIATQAELVTQYTGSFQSIYGASINLGPETPDGQLMMTFIQSVLDVEDLLLNMNAMFDPDQAIGVILDQRVAINGIQRQAGTYTITDVTIVTSQSVNLYGLDQTANPVFTVADAAGHQYYLQTSVLGTGTGSFVYVFQAATPGALIPAINSITVPVTIILGVSSINNPTAYSVLGINEETDAQLRVRRQKSVSLPSQGYLAGLLAALENISGVTYAAVYENNGGTTIGSGPLTGLPGHTIWVVTAGSGSPSAIAQAIYTKRNAGAGMYGSISYAITQVDSSIFDVYWDDVVEQTLYTKFTVTSLNGTTPPNIPGMLDNSTGLPATFVPGVFAQVNANELSTLVQDIDPNTLASNIGFSTSLGGSYVAVLSPSAAPDQFSVAGSNIIIIPAYITGSGTTASTTLTVNSSGSVVSALTIATSGSQQFAINGGYNVGVTTPWSFMSHGSSGSTLNTATGAYVAGAAGTDVVKYTDNFSPANTAIVTITVT